MPNATNKQAREHHDAGMLIFVLRDKIYTVTTRDDMRLSDCLAIATQDLRDRYTTALANLAEMERGLQRQGRGWIDSLGHFHINRK